MGIVISILMGLFFQQSYAHYEMGEPAYTQFGFHAERGVSYTTNYRAGKCIPQGSKVTVMKVTPGYAKLAVKGVGEVKLVNVKKYSKLSMIDYLNRMLGSKKPEAKGKEFKTEIGTCSFSIGMSKDQVIAAVGYPPTHKTPSTDDNSWRYWRKRFDSELLTFVDGKLEKIED